MPRMPSLCGSCSYRKSKSLAKRTRPVAFLIRHCSREAACKPSRRYFLRVRVTFANDDSLPVLSALSIVHDHVSFLRS
jgi:hypothetical protein